MANPYSATASSSFADAASLARAFEGAIQVLIVSVDKMGGEAVRLHRAAIDAAVEAGARRVLYTSHVRTMACRPGEASQC